jgi:hypothetical protein
MNDKILFPDVQDPLSVNERFAQICDSLAERLLSRDFVLTAKPDGRQYWKKDVGLFTLRVLFTTGWSERGTIHVDEMVQDNFVGASTIFRSVYTPSQLERILCFIDSYE